VSSSPQVHCADRVMADEAVRAMLECGFCGRLATVGGDGYPHCGSSAILRLLIAA